MFYLKLFREFFYFDQKSEPPTRKDHTPELFDFIDTLHINEYIKKALKNYDDLIIIWNTHHAFKEGIKDLMKLFEQSQVDYYNDYIQELKQNSHIRSFYDSIEDFIKALDRVNSYLEHPESRFILTNVLGYCHPVALRYMSETALDHILKNKDMLSKFQALWVSKTNFTFFDEEGGAYSEIPTTKWELTGVKPFVPTSDQEHEEKILEIILDTKNDGKN